MCSLFMVEFKTAVLVRGKFHLRVASEGDLQKYCNFIGITARGNSISSKDEGKMKNRTKP